MLHEQIKKIFNDKPKRIKGWQKWPDCSDEMIAEINSYKPELVLDLGCGTNIFKGHIDNIVGVDILDNNQQDINAPIEDLPFEDNSVDIALAFGSINFGDDNLIDKQLQETIRVCKPNARIYFRGIQNNTAPWYEWTIQKVLEKTIKHNLNYIEVPRLIYRRQQSRYLPDRSMSRIFCVWSVKK